MHREIFWVNGWLLIVESDGKGEWGSVYFPKGEPTLCVAANFGNPGDAFPDRKSAIGYFSLHAPEQE